MVFLSTILLIEKPAVLFTVYEIGCLRQPQVLSVFRLGNPRSRKFKIEGTRNLRLPNQRLLGTWLRRHQTLFAYSLRSWWYCLRAKIIFSLFGGARGRHGRRLCRFPVRGSAAQTSRLFVCHGHEQPFTSNYARQAGRIARVSVLCHR